MTTHADHALALARDRLPFHSRRSDVLATQGMVATSQPLATAAGLALLRQGGNAADAAVAAAAALNVTEPCSTGIGGDCFCLYYSASEKRVYSLNGSGRCPRNTSIASLRAAGFTGDELPPLDVHTVTVPGTCAGWVDTVEQFGSKAVSLADILEPAIHLAEEGYPVHHITAGAWAQAEGILKTQSENGGEMLLEGRAPREGDIMKMPNLAETFRAVARDGKKGFYEGRIAQEIVTIVQQLGGDMTLEDLAEHRSETIEPIVTEHLGLNVWECPPNGQGLTALIALNILEHLPLSEHAHNSASYLHLLIEALRLAFADARHFISDPAHTTIPVHQLLSKEYAKSRAQSVSLSHATVDVREGSPVSSSDTVYLSVVDAQGNACSFIQSNYMGFGSAIVPRGCGFTLQNRGSNFTLDASHRNALAPGKRPYHTIIPCMATHSDTGALYACYGVMGGFMQPQGHVQVLLNMRLHGMAPQAALDAPRICLQEGTAESSVLLETGITPETIATLAAMGHNVLATPVTDGARAVFGRGQIIAPRDNGVLWAGSDPRADGCAMGIV